MLGLTNVFLGLVDKRKVLGSLYRDYGVNRDVAFQSLYEGSINSLAVEAAESKYLLCGTGSGVIAIYDVTLGAAKSELAPIAHIGKSSRFCPGNVNTASWYSLHSGIFASSGDEGTLHIWDTNLLRPLDKYRIGCNIYHHAFGTCKNNSSLIAIASELPAIKIVDFRTGSSSHALDTHDSGNISVSWSPIDDRILCSGGKNGRALIWDFRNCKRPLVNLSRKGFAHANVMDNNCWKNVRAHSGAVLGLHFPEDNHCLLTIGRDRHLRSWDIRTGKWMTDVAYLNNNMLPSIHHLDIASITRESSPPVTIVADGKGIQIISLLNGEVLRRVGGHFDQISALVVVNDGSFRIITAGHDQSMLLWSYGPISMTDR